MSQKTKPPFHKGVPAHRNVMLYWDDEDIVPKEIAGIVEEWRRICSGWNIKLFGMESARDFLRDNFGKDISQLFLTCALPAMRSDFFRVCWAFSRGGIYCDLRHVPLREPLFFLPGKNLTLPLHDIGTVTNRIFYSKVESCELKLVQSEIIKSLRERKHESVWGATGPGAWMRALVPGPNRKRKIKLRKMMTQGQKGEIELVTWENVLKFFHDSNYPGPERFSHEHWTVQQLHVSIYRQGDN